MIQCLCPTGLADTTRHNKAEDATQADVEQGEGHSGPWPNGDAQCQSRGLIVVLVPFTFTWAITPQVGQPCGDRVSSTCTRRAAPGTSSTSRITMSGRPTSDTHRLQIVSGVTGALQL